MPSPLRSLLCSLLSLWGIVSTQGHPSEGWEAKKYPCVVCDSLVESLFDGQHFDEACESMQVCDFLAPHRDRVLRAFKGVPGGPKAWANASSALARDTVSRMVCEGVGLCEAVKDMAITSTGIPDVRVTPVYASKGYAYVRVSLIDDASAAEDITTTPSDLFTYSQPFRYRWTDKRLSSGLLKVAPGESTKVTIQGTDFDIYLPEEGQGTRGVIIADPCFSGKWVGCQYGSTLQTLKRITGFINAACENDRSEGGIDFWMILGDNFYDRSGELSSQFFSMLTAKAKSKIFAASPGNHDYWVGGSPLISVKGKDQFANGFMQYYAMDAEASKEDSVNFLDFSQDPSKGGLSKLKANLPSAKNFNAYFKIGNLAFISYSGAYDDKAVQPFLEEACGWLSGQGDVVNAFVIGHWNDGGLGCSNGMDVPSVRSKMESIEGCSAFGNKLKYFMGHTHCNEVTETGIGFMVAGMGMEGCGNFGIPVLDSTSASRSNQSSPKAAAAAAADGLVYYFPIQDAKDAGQGDKYNATISCFEQKGVGGCLAAGLATKWA
mmetsp:Transcript_6123/g.9541  ORF Transcript_6123/g.9541 Transcript_6123/m.9541 type:complete len:548 (-) Transcript_6123:442-2085(-)